MTPNPYRDRNFQTVREALKVLKDAGMDVRICLPFEVDRSYELPKDLRFSRLDRELPNADAIICFGGASPGHVAIVEEIHDNGVIVTSNSAWRGSYFYLETLTPDANGVYHYQGSSYYTSQGFIYNPFAGGGDDPVEYNKKKHYNFVLFNRRKREQQEWIRKNLMKS